MNDWSRENLPLDEAEPRIERLLDLAGDIQSAQINTRRTKSAAFALAAAAEAAGYKWEARSREGSTWIAIEDGRLVLTVFYEDA